MRYRFTALLLLGLITLPACRAEIAIGKRTTEYSSYTPPTMTDTTGLYRHVVAFKFKENTTHAQIDAIVKDFAALQDAIPDIIAFEHGKQVSPEGFDQGYTHIFIVTFKDAAGLEVYLPHPAHQAFVEKLLPLLDPPPFVVDYVAE